jgi:hypothetical protein
VPAECLDLDFLRGFGREDSSGLECLAFGGECGLGLGASEFEALLRGVLGRVRDIPHRQNVQAIQQIFYSEREQVTRHSQLCRELAVRNCVLRQTRK